METCVGNRGALNIVGLLKACANQKDLHRGSKLHAYIRDYKVLEKNSIIGTALVNMYVRCGALERAQQVLEELPVRNVVAWTVLIAGYAKYGQGDESLKCFDRMLYEGNTPDTVTCTCVLTACGTIGAAARGEEIHDKIVSAGMLEKDVVLGSTLVDMYTRCGVVAKAQKVLQELPVRNVVTWNALISGYVQQGQGNEALKCFDFMQLEGHTPDVVTFTCVLKACGSIGAASKGEHIHLKILSLGMLEKDIALGGTLVDMYARCGALAKAQQVLKELPFRDAVSWTALIAGYAQQEEGNEALICFDNMEREGHFPDAVTLMCALKACGSIGAIAKGKQLHEKIISLGMLQNEIELGNTLVDMYARCGALTKAQQVLEELPVRNEVTWNALIAGYAHQGQGEEALKCFDSMHLEGHSPDAISLIFALKACSQSSLLDQAEKFFSRMSTDFGIARDAEHYCCMVDLFGRAGKFNEALSLINKMPSDEYYPAWVALLGACVKWGDAEIGRYAFKHTVY